MRIGILTFHWATNYGAILQAFSLQSYLVESGYDVDIINYKPLSGDIGIKYLIKHPSLWRDARKIFVNIKKEKLLSSFRNIFLKITPRYYKVEELSKIEDVYDVIITGSDQVFSPSFTMSGENGKATSAYWLGFCKSAKRVGYAVSFGCEIYPENVAQLVKQWVNCFEVIGVREQSGLQILKQLGYKGNAEVMPDPTLLLGKRLFNLIGINIPEIKEDYICVYMLRQEIQVEGSVRYIDEKHRPLSMAQWLETIACARGLITNSYHGMIIAMLAHVPFSVILETGRASGMNDRFFTLLGRTGLENRVCKSVNEAIKLLEQPIDFIKIDTLVEKYSKVGCNFLSAILN